MKLGDRLLCIFIQSQSVNDTFKEWPVHLTLLPWFRINKSSDELAILLNETFVGCTAFQITIKNEAQFGYKQAKIVNLAEAPELYRLEGQARRLLHKYKAWVVDEADKTRKHFRPHITVLKTGRMHEKDTFSCDRIFIVSQQVDFKRIDAEIKL